MLGAASVLQRRSAATTKSEVRSPVKIFSVFNFNRLLGKAKTKNCSSKSKKQHSEVQQQKSNLPRTSQKAKSKTVSVFKLNRLLGQAKTKGLQQQKQKSTFRSSATKKIAQNQAESKKQNRPKPLKTAQNCGHEPYTRFRRAFWPSLRSPESYTQTGVLL